MTTSSAPGRANGHDGGGGNEVDGTAGPGPGEAATEPGEDGEATGALAEEAIERTLSTFTVDQVQTTGMVVEKLEVDEARARRLLEALCERDRLRMARSGTGLPVWLRR